MKITVWGINYAPEPTGIGPYNTDLCEWLVRAGHEVEVLTTFSYYPAWRKRPEDRGCWGRTECRAGVRVRRCWHYVPARTSTLRRLFHELSFVVTSTVRGLGAPPADVYVVVSPPLFLALGALVVAGLRHRPFVFHVQDLQPDAAAGLGMLKPGLALRVLYALERWSYRCAARVTGISAGMLTAFAEKGVPATRRGYWPNWARGDAARANPAAAMDWRKHHGIPAGAFLAVYSGNLGVKQGLEGVVEAAALMASGRRTPMPPAPSAREVWWVIAGDGAARPALEARLAAVGPEARLRLLPLQPAADYAAMLAAADVCLIAQQRGTGRFFFPSKLLSMLGAGRPVVAVADDDSELALAVRAGGFGRVVAPGDAAALAATLTELASAPPEELAALARAGDAWLAGFAPHAVLPRIETELRALAASEAAAAAV